MTISSYETLADALYRIDLATNAAEWLAALNRLKSDRQLGRRLGAQGRRLAESQFDTNKLVDVLAEVLTRAGSSPS